MSHLNPQALFLAAMFAGGVAVLVYFIVRNQVFAAALLLVLFLLSDGIRDQLSLSIGLSGTRVSALDAVTTILLGVGLFRVLTLGVRSFARGLSIALLVLLLFHVARGIADYGFTAAINGSRDWVYFTAPLIFAATAPVPWNRRVWQLIASTGIALAAISIPYFLIDGLHTASQYVYRDGQQLTARPLVAAGALVVLQAAILLLAFGWPSRGTSSALACVAIAVVVLVQHRTVWVAAVAVVAIGFVDWSRRRMRDAEALVLGATGMAFLMLPVLVYGFVHTSALVHSAAETTASSSTFSWRTTSWQELIASHHSVSDLAAGGPSGASWARQIADSTVQGSPHDAFIEAFLRFGLPGLVVFLGLWIVVWRRRSSFPWHVGLTPSVTVLLLTSQAIYGVAYPLGEVQGLIFGVFISGLALERSEGDATHRARRALHSRAFPRERIDSGLASRIT